MITTLLEQLRARLAGYVPPAVDFGPEIAGFRDAAVLVPLVERDGALHMVFTQRPESMRTHSGQVSFPGGKRDDDDADLVATALREADEELGIAATSVSVLGRLTQVPTPSGYVITPVVGVLASSAAAFRVNAQEVAEVFDVPVAVLRDPATVKDRGEARRFGYRWQLIEYHAQGHVIWGATARMVTELLEVWGR